MTFSIGIDIVNISEFEKILNQTPRFINKCFNSEEKSLGTNKLAGNFASKEALRKTFPELNYFLFCDCSVLRKTNGQPYFKFYGKLNELVSNYEIKVSISNHDDYTIAVVMAILY